MGTSAMTNCRTNLTIDPKLRDAIRTAIEEGEYDIGGVIDALEEHGFDFDAVQRGIEQMLYARELLVGWPMSRVDLESSISILDLHVGSTTIDQLAERLEGSPYRSVIDGAGRREMAWILYLEAVDESCNVPPITTPYAQRDLAEPSRPADCNLPYVPIIPPEVIELVCWFNEDTLVDSSIRVHLDEQQKN